MIVALCLNRLYLVSLDNFEEESLKIINKIGVAQSRKRGIKSGDCIRWLKGALSF